MTIFELAQIFLEKGFFFFVEALEIARNKPSGVVPSLTTMSLCFS